MKPHDLLKIKDVNLFLASHKDPKWIKESLICAPYVVVRRSPINNKKIPIGIRGTSRNHRFASFIHSSEVESTVTPEDLVAKKTWKHSSRYNELVILQALEAVDEIVKEYGFIWGPTGSAGFELASGTPTLTEMSDLDLVIRAPEFLVAEEAVQLFTELSSLGIRADIQIETPNGAISLAEYVRGDKQVLLRTMDGPVLTGNPWHLS